MKQVIAASLIMMLCACGFMMPLGNEASQKNAYNKWVGHPLDELLVEYGEPTNINVLEKGSRTFEYWEPETSAQSSESAARAPVVEDAGLCGGNAVLERMILGDNPSRPEIIGINACHPNWAGTWRTRTSKKSKPEQAQNCMILFKVSGADIVESWSRECEKQD